MYDTDGDGLIENSGFADQTYDAWPVTGPRYRSFLHCVGGGGGGGLSSKAKKCTKKRNALLLTNGTPPCYPTPFVYLILTNGTPLERYIPFKLR